MGAERDGSDGRNVCKYRAGEKLGEDKFNIFHVGFHLGPDRKGYV